MDFLFIFLEKYKNNMTENDVFPEQMALFLVEHYTWCEEHNLPYRELEEHFKDIDTYRKTIIDTKNYFDLIKLHQDFIQYFINYRVLLKFFPLIRDMLNEILINLKKNTNNKNFTTIIINVIKTCDKADIVKVSQQFAKATSELQEVIKKCEHLIEYAKHGVVYAK